MKYLLILVLLLPGCASVMSAKDVEEHIAILKANNPMGCAYIAGSGTPPASRVDGGAVGGWGEGMTIEQMLACLDKLKGLQ